MTGIEIFLIIVGVIALAISFFGDKIFENKEETNSFDNKFNDEIIQQKVSAAIDGIIDEKVESTEIKIEKILNEKIMTVGEYSDNVISEIDKNHNEVMFLYGMLNDKEKEVKNTLIDIENIKKSIKKIEVEKENKAQEKNVITEKTYENKSEEKKNIRSNSGRNNQGKANLSKNNSAKNVTSKQSKNSNSLLLAHLIISCSLT